jgi:Tol biopolymer transport system component/tRNA A-37 threonylcarbamoyl transferase component Bud32
VGEKRGHLDALLDVELVLAQPATAETAKLTTIEGEPANAGEHFAPEMMLGKYRLDRLLGAGGMGEVWDAHDTDLDRRVALKLLRRDGRLHGRQIREARAMARLRHPNVISVFDAATIDGHDVIVMELVEGQTLAGWLARPRKQREIVAMLLAAGRGLAAAHAAGLVHRDFKPQNVLVDPRGRAVVTDFGLARAVGEPGEPPLDRPSGRDPHALAGALDSPLTAAGAVLGTPAYMAPEQLAGDSADERADQFAFCVTLWEALCGERPFARTIVVPRGGDRVPRSLRKLLARGLKTDPAERWPSLVALLDAIERAWRRPRRIAIAAAVVAVVALGALGVRLLLRPAPWQPAIVDLPAFEENSDGAAISPDGTRIAYASDREETGVFRLYVEPLAGGEARAVTPAGTTVISPRWARDGASLLAVVFDNRALRYRLVRQPLAGGPLQDLGTGVGVDDCGDVLAVADIDNHASRLLLQDSQGRRSELLAVHDGYAVVPRCDPSGERIAVMRGKSPNQNPPLDNVVVVDRLGHATQITSGNRSGAAAFTPDGERIVFSGADAAGILLFEVPATGGQLRRITLDHGPHLNPDIAPDGRTLIFDRDVALRIAVAGGGGAPLRKLSARQETLNSFVVTSDGNAFIAERLGEGGSEVVVIDPRSGSERPLVAGAHPFLALDERRVLFQLRGVEPPTLAVVPLAGNERSQILAVLPGALVDGIDAPGGPHIEVRAEGRTTWWRLAQGGRLVREPDGLPFLAPSGGWRAVRTFDHGYHYQLVGPDGEPGRDLVGESTRPSWLDGRRFAYAAGGAFHIIDATTGIELATVPGPDWGEHALLARDGVHWYGLQAAGHVTRHLLTNFAER